MSYRHTASRLPPSPLPLSRVCVSTPRHVRVRWRVVRLRLRVTCDVMSFAVSFSCHFMSFPCHVIDHRQLPLLSAHCPLPTAIVHCHFPAARCVCGLCLCRSLCRSLCRGLCRCLTPRPAAAAEPFSGRSQPSAPSPQPQPLPSPSPSPRQPYASHRITSHRIASHSQRIQRIPMHTNAFALSLSLPLSRSRALTRACAPVSRSLWSLSLLSLLQSAALSFALTHSLTPSHALHTRNVTCVSAVSVTCDVT